MAMRRSTRERRKPTEIYSVERAQSGASGGRGGGDERAATDQEGENEVSEEEEDGEEEESDDGDEEDDRRKGPKARRGARATPLKKRARPRATAKRQLQRKVSARSEADPRATSTQETDAGVDEEDGEQESLFDAVQDGRSLRKALAKWRNRFDENEDEGTRELLNFVFHACGATSTIVAESVSLEKLDLSEPVEAVVKELAQTQGSYPIAPRTKGSKRFHRNYADFWEALVAECHESEVLFTSNVVTKVIDWLTTLSSSEVRAVRHTATVGIYALAIALANAAATISQQLMVVNRQLGIPGSRAGTPTRKSPNARREALLKENKALYESRLQQLLSTINLVFNGVFAHRYRDVMAEIRAESVLVIGHWITTLPDQYLKDNFLKYLGWLLNDKSALVRFHVVEALQSLYEQETFAPKLELFTSRFLPRYLQLCDDVDDDVIEATIRLLIAVDKSKMISSDVDLQSVERLVFDAENADIRKTAAEFVCLQYDAFGVAHKKNEKLNKEQLNTQTIALVEFAQEYIQNHGVPLEAVATLVDAFWGLDDCLVLGDWKLLTNLLLMDKSAPDLTSDQQSILLAILIAAIRKLLGEFENQGSSHESKKNLATEQEEITITFCREIPNLLTTFQSDADKLTLLTQLIPMLSLRGDVVGQYIGQITEIAEKMKHAYLLHSDEAMLGTFAVSFSHLLQADYETVKREVAVVIHELIQAILDRLSQQLDEDEIVVEKLVADAVDEASKSLANQMSKKVKKKKAKKTARTSSKEAADVEFGLRISLCRLSCLMSYVNIGEYLPSTIGSSSASTAEPSGAATAADTSVPATDASHEGTTAPSSRMNEAISSLVKLITRRTQAVLRLGEEFRHPDTFRHALMVVYHHLLWLTAPVFARPESELSDIALAGDGSAVDRVVAEMDRVIQGRALLEEALVSVLNMHLEPSSRERIGTESSELKEIEFENEETLMFVRTAQHLAFITFCDARCLFVEKMQSFLPPFDALQWRVPKALVILAQMHFESEMETTYTPHPDDETSGNNDNEDQEASLSAEEKQARKKAWEDEQKQKAELLAALGRAALCNPSNKRQAAAVLAYFTSEDKTALEVIKEFSKQVKADAPVRYLEIQMTALRRAYNALLGWKEELAALEADTSGEETIQEEIGELNDTIETSALELEDLAKRLSRSLGVGKIAASLRASFLRFLCEGVRYSLERKSHFGFLAAMRPFLSHLDRASTRQLHGYFEQSLEALEKRGVVRSSGDDGDDSGDDDEWRLVSAFQATISVGAANRIGGAQLRKERPSSRSSVAAIASASIAEQDEREDSDEHDPKATESVPTISSPSQQDSQHPVATPSPRKRGLSNDKTGEDADATSMEVDTGDRSSQKKSRLG